MRWFRKPIRMAPPTSLHPAADGLEPTRPVAGTAAAVLGALRWNVTMRTAAQIVTWSITIFVVRLLTPGDYGLMGLAQILIGFCLLVNHLGAVPALVQQREIAPSILRQTFALVLLSNTVLYLILFAGAPYFSQFFDEPRLTAIVRVLAFTLLIGAFSAVPYALLQRELNFKGMSLTEFAASSFGALTTLVMVIAGNGVWGLVIGNLATVSVTTVGLLVLTRFRLLPQFRFAGFGRTLSFGLTVSGSNILWYLNSSLSGLIIGKALGSTDLGYYTVMRDFAMLPLNKLMRVTNQIALAAYSRIQEDRALARRYFFDSARIMLLVLFPIAWGMAAVASDLIVVVLGPQWLPAALVLQVIALGMPLRALDLIMNPMVTGLGRPDIALRNTLTGTLIIPPAIIVGLPWGLLGVCITGTVGSLLAILIVLRRNFAVIEASIGQLLLLYLPPIVSAGVMYIAVAAAEATLLHQMPILWRLGSAVMLGAAVYSLMTMLVNRDAALRALQLVAMRRPGNAVKREVNAIPG
jgi:O-antigen/teichoic acid export membrane protein